jgi:hypothetical protein
MQVTARCQARFGRHCATCPSGERCTTAARWPVIVLHPYHALPAAARAFATTDAALPAAYLDAGMVTEAVAFSGIDQTRQIPLSQAYDLAARLGEAGSGHGQRVYAAIEGFGFDDGDNANVAGHENNVHKAWAKAATRYRTFPHVLDVLGTFWPEPDAVDDDDVPRFQRPGAS